MDDQLEFKFTKEMLAEFIPHAKDLDDWYKALSMLLPKYGISTKRRVAAFLANTSHESAGYTALSENLRYSAEGLAKVWPKRFSEKGKPNDVAVSIAKNPEAIANHVYCDRMGNGNTESGDGWKYRGRGLIQLTGKENYKLFAEHLHKSLDDTVAYLETKVGAVESACWYWKRNNLNALADTKQLELMTKRINGGLHGHDDRVENFNIVMALLGPDNNDRSDTNSIA